MKPLLAASLTGIAFFCQTSAYAQSPHVHGLANADVAMIGEALEIALTIPADSLLGFEHAPENAEQRKAIKDAKQLLKTPEQLFAFSNRSCELESSELSMPERWEEHSDHEHDHDDHHEHKHDKHEQDDHHEHKHDEHDHGDHDDHKHDEHADITSSYTFTCEGNGSLEISMLLFAELPNLKEINVNWLSDSQQGKVSLSASDTTIAIN